VRSRKKKRSRPGPPPPSGKVVATLPLSDKSEYEIRQSQLDHWQTLYGAVDVKQQLNAMRGWCESNHCKTRSGVNRFINNWLNREQNSGRKKGNGESQWHFRLPDDN
jgi:hypothetical protein